jgi:hypothetical protein
MPTIELYGFDTARQAYLITEFRRRLGDLPFREQVVFVPGCALRVIAWNGEDRPFVRVLTRAAERAAAIRTCINDLADVETVIIGFHPQNTEEPGAPPDGTMSHE